MSKRVFYEIMLANYFDELAELCQVYLSHHNLGTTADNLILRCLYIDAMLYTVWLESLLVHLPSCPKQVPNPGLVAPMCQISRNYIYM